MQDTKIDTFLAAAGWGGATCDSLAGDASSRRYERVKDQDRKAILMIDPSPENLQRFVKITDILAQSGYSVPEILAADKAQGYLLLEDFGDHLFAQLVEQGTDERVLYELAVDFLVDLRDQPLPTGLPFFSPSYVLDQNILFLDWYVPEITGAPLPAPARKFYQQIWKQLLEDMSGDPERLLMRDFHAENLFYLPERAGLKALGLIDYQDAMIGPAAYDLVSLLQDARRDVTPALEKDMLNRYMRKSGVDPVKFLRLYALMGTHRALRIMGVFTRLSKQDGKTRYLAFMPRMHAHLQKNLRHPALIALRHWLDVTIGKQI